MRINNNLMAMNTHRQLGIGNNNGAKSMEKLSSGFRINRAGDDAAGLSISEKMRGQIRGLNQASRNAQDGISMIQTAEGALQETHAILQRMIELAVHSASDTNVSADRQEIQKEMNQLTSEINRIGNTTEFNTQKIINGDIKGAGTVAGTANGVLSVENSAAGTVGASFTSDNVVTDGTTNTATQGALDVSTHGNATKAIEVLDLAIKNVSAERSKLGAYQNRLEHTIKNLDTSSENLQASESRIKDVDMAKEMMEFTKNNILQQAAQAMLAQANQQPQGVLQLLR